MPNIYIIKPLIAWAIAQTLKTIIYSVTNKELDLERMIGSGGMPSAHSAVVSCLTTSIYLDSGYNSQVFAISLIFSLIIIYDATNVRMSVGRQAQILNKMLHEYQMSHVFDGIKLKELIGHTPFEVIIGVILGVIIGLF